MKQGYFTSEDLFLFAEGTWLRCYDKLGAHPMKLDGENGYFFAVWAPDVKSVHVVGSFNDWNTTDFAMQSVGDSGIWQTFIPNVPEGASYKYFIECHDGRSFYKADPMAFYAEVVPQTASRTADLGYRWHDGLYLARRKKLGHMGRPLNIYEVHLSSWRRHEDGSFYTYAEFERELIPYVLEMGYSHIELMPVTEHPFDGSWGYQTTGYFAATSRYGSPTEFMSFVDACHAAGIGVILDWAPGHFCRDAHGLGRFNGEMLYECGDHKHWGTYKMNFGRGEVRSFLLSSALFWLEQFHIDGIRVDGVTSMLYLNFDRDEGDERLKNHLGGEENLDAINFIRQLNSTVGQRFPGVMMIAEESTAWPFVTRPPESGGLGFHYKWDMGWMNDTLRYCQVDFPFRRWSQNLLTFSTMYAFNENFILPLSHDEVVHGKCSLIGRMPGDYWRQFAGVRALQLYQMCHSGAKLNFMGNEFAPFIEWRWYEELEWFMLGYEAHEKHRRFNAALGNLYLQERALWEKACVSDGFRWLDADDADHAVLSFLRSGKRPADDLIVLLNFCPEVEDGYRVGVPSRGTYEEIFNSDCVEYGGSGRINAAPIKTENIPWQGMPCSIVVKTPPIGGAIFKKCKTKGRSKT